MRTITGWISKESYNYFEEMKSEARTRSIPVHTFPLDITDEPVVIVIGVEEVIEDIPEGIF